jgi:hypothetical protein
MYRRLCVLPMSFVQMISSRILCFALCRMIPPEIESGSRSWSERKQIWQERRGKDFNGSDYHARFHWRPHCPVLVRADVSAHDPRDMLRFCSHDAEQSIAHLSEPTAP